MREERRDERIVSRLQYEEMLSRGTPPAQRFRAEVSRLFGTPLIMLATEPIVGLTTIYMAAAYGLVYIEFEVYPIIFDEVHSLGTGYSSLPFLAILVGALVSVPIQLYFQKVYVRRVEGSGGKHTPEMRLPPAQWGGIVTVAAFIMQGWTGYKSSIPWCVYVRRSRSIHQTSLLDLLLLGLYLLCPAFFKELEVSCYSGLCRPT